MSLQRYDKANERKMQAFAKNFSLEETIMNKTAERTVTLDKGRVDD